MRNEEILNNRINRYRGCLIGGAIGDALGYPIEFVNSYDKIKEMYGPIGINKFDLKNGKALISDDTQMTLFTAIALLWQSTRMQTKGIAPDIYNCLHMAYKDWYNTQLRSSDRNKDEFRISWIYRIPELNECRAPGMTCMNSLSSDTLGTIENPINDSKGCGGVMRVAPIGLYYSRKFKNHPEEVGKIGAEAAAITHGNQLGIIPAYVFSLIIFHLVNNYDIEEAVKLSLETFNRDSDNYDAEKKEVFNNLINKAINFANSGKNDIAAINELGHGWVAEEALAIAIYSSLKHKDNFEEALICSVNHGGDSDSTGAITGNIMGAFLGLNKIPDYYINNLELKDIILEIADDLYIELPDKNISQYSLENVDEYWLSKYLYNDRDLNKKSSSKLDQYINSYGVIDSFPLIYDLAYNIEIKSDDPFVIDSCRILYIELMIVCLYDNIDISDILKILENFEESISMIDKFNNLYKKDNFDMLYVNSSNIESLKYLINTLHDSLKK